MQLKKKTWLFIAMGIVAAIILFILAVRLTPWFYAVNIRVKLYLDASADTKINICWDEAKRECLPFVPYSKANNGLAQSGQIANIWITELPPRPVYHLSITFESGIYNAKFHRLELDTSQIFLLIDVDRAEMGVNNSQIPAQDFKTHDSSVKPVDGSFYIESSGSGQLILRKDILPGLSEQSKNNTTTLIIWGLLLSIYLLFAIPVFLFPNAISNLGSAASMTTSSKYSWWVYFFIAVMAGAMILLVKNSGVLFNQYDPLNYLLTASESSWFNDARLPGYPLFLGFALFLSKYSLDGVVISQAVLLSVSVILCIWMLRRWLHPFLAVLFALLCLFSPSQVHWARWILRESMFASLVLIGVTMAIAHFTSSRSWSAIWLVVFAALCGVAFLIRENGILLVVALFPALAPKLIKQLRSSGMIWEQVHSTFLLAFQYIDPIIAIGAVYLIFSTYNYLHYGYFQVVSQQAHVPAKKTLFTGNFDARSLLEPPLSEDKILQPYAGWQLYSSFILTRDRANEDPIYGAFLPIVNQLLSERDIEYNIFTNANIIKEIGKASETFVPWKANLVGVLRQYRDTVSLHSRGGYSQTLDYLTPNKQELLDNLPTHIKISFDEKFIAPDSFIAKYYRSTQSYKWYGLIFFLALVSSLYILRFEDPVFLAPIAVFLANIFLLLFTRMVNFRYIESLDILLSLQVAIGLSCLLYRCSFSRRKPI